MSSYRNLNSAGSFLALVVSHFRIVQRKSPIQGQVFPSFFLLKWQQLHFYMFIFCQGNPVSHTGTWKQRKQIQLISFILYPLYYLANNSLPMLSVFLSLARLFVLSFCVQRPPQFLWVIEGWATVPQLCMLLMVFYGCVQF